MGPIEPYTGGAPLAHTPLAYSDAQQAESVPSYDLTGIFLAVRKRWRLFLAVFLGVVGLVAVGTIAAPKSYTTTVRLLVGRPGNDVAPSGNDTALPVLNALVLQSGAQSAETLATLAQQRDIAAGVTQQLNLPDSPEALLSHVSVKPVVNTSLLNLSVKWRSPAESAQIANAFATSFVDQEREFVRSQAVAAIRYLSQELPRAGAEMRAAASRLAQFQSSHGYIDAGAHAQSIVAAADSIDQRIDQLSVDIKEASAQLASVNSQLSSISATIDSAKDVAANPVTTDLRTKLAAVQTELAAAQQRYTSQHPTVIALQQQRDALIKQLASQPAAVVSQTTVAPNPLYQSLQQQAASFRGRIEGDQGQLEALEAQKKAYRPAIAAMPSQAIAFTTVQEEAKRAANVYNALEQKYNDALVAKTTAISDIVVVQSASADSAVKSPSLRVNLGIALVIGLLLGLAVVAILDLLDRRASDAAFTQRLGLPVIARIPAFDTPNARLLPWLQSMTMEAFFHLCVTLKVRASRPPKTLAILSARRGEGKSTVALNLAKSFASLQAGILLIDADLRKPTLHEKAGCGNAVTINDVLRGSATLEDAVQALAPGLDLLAGQKDENPVALLQSSFKSLLERAAQKYSMIIVDAPAHAVSDALLIAADTEASLIVVGADRVAETETQALLARINLIGAGNGVIGLVVNRDHPPANYYDDYLTPKDLALTAGSA
ncbi:MAG: AAA family ATPase [Candidatus Eremiobacteraeota bacterium]|nr:AAA family ATPase [Candidatus Eremiobacteraeota bacterium]MBV9055385.1 AAA family ATPase [Candidatus Eremiobacteraeota bacterium]MBV9700192.1 AAA family ATPase [Candidatus Eremiobacteraeota bacterium]